MSRPPFRLHWFVDHAQIGKRAGLTSIQSRKLTFRSLEAPRRTNDLLLVVVVGMGFLMDSYVLFTSNAVLPMLGYVYWHSATHTGYEVAFNAATLGGCILGMILFGFLADHFGRRKLYGIALLVLIVGTFGVVTSSVGFTPVRHDFEGDYTIVDWETRGSMNIVAWLLFWRFVSGVGLGGDYPLTASIVAEFAPTVKRGRLLAAVFFMQAIGIASGSIITLIVVSAAKRHQPVPDARTIDQIWRWIIGISLVLACLAMILRLNIPESPRFVMDVLDDDYRAFHDADRFRSTHLQGHYNTQAAIELVRRSAGQASTNAQNHDTEAQTPSENPRTRQTWREYFVDVKVYFWTQGHGQWLAGASIAWFALDVAFYALSLNSPQMVSKLWYQAPQNPDAIKVWNADFDVVDQDRQIYTILISNSWHSLIVTSSGALLGGAAMIYAIEHANRKKFQWISFVVLGVLFLITGPVYVFTVFSDRHEFIIMLYCLCELTFYFGPNTLTFIYPAEIFPTPYRATCHGISAAAGKLGSLVIQLILAYVRINGHSSGSIDAVARDLDGNWLGWALMFFSLPMFLGAGVTFLLPELRSENGIRKTLEEISEGPVGRRTANRNINGGINGNAASGSGTGNAVGGHAVTGTVERSDGTRRRG